MSENHRSPFKEVGLTGRWVSTQAKSKRRQPKGFSVRAGRVLLPEGHIYDARMAHKGEVLTTPRQARLTPYRRCGQPRYAIEGQPCRGRRK